MVIACNRNMEGGDAFLLFGSEGGYQTGVGSPLQKGYKRNAANKTFSHAGFDQRFDCAIDAGLCLLR
jgi:hypothetical protein